MMLRNMHRVSRLIVLAVVGVLAPIEIRAHGSGITGHWGFAPGHAPAPNWRAQWIWLPESDAADMLLARKVFTVSDLPERSMLSITASSCYELHLNGTYLSRGPARSAPHHRSFDVLDVTRALKKGRNSVAIRVHHQHDSVSYYDSSRGGLLAQLDCTPGSTAPALQTDASWRVSPDRRWLDASPRMARFHLEVCDRVDLRRAVGLWSQSDFDDGAWANARVLRRVTGWPTL